VHDDPTLLSTYGVKRSSILNQSRYFHVVDGLDLDVMHDQLEGVLPLEIKLLLQKYIRVDKFYFGLVLVSFHFYLDFDGFYFLFYFILKLNKQINLKNKTKYSNQKKK